MSELNMTIVGKPAALPEAIRKKAAELTGEAATIFLATKPMLAEMLKTHGDEETLKISLSGRFTATAGKTFHAVASVIVQSFSPDLA